MYVLLNKFLAIDLKVLICLYSTNNIEIKELYLTEIIFSFGYFEFEKQETIKPSLGTSSGDITFKSLSRYRVNTLL